MSKAKRRRQADRRARFVRDFSGPVCDNCGRRGPHFVPPSLGEPGFYACAGRSFGAVVAGLRTDERGLLATLELPSPDLAPWANPEHDIIADLHNAAQWSAIDYRGRAG